MATPLARNLRWQRRATGLSQTALAHRTGLSQTWVSRLESGTANPTISTLECLAQALDISVSELLDAPHDQPSAFGTD